MKLIFENWRRYINENVQINKSTERLLAMLVNLKKFNGTEDFFSRTKLVIHQEEDRLNFGLLIDNKVAGMVSYFILRKEENCRPQPHQNKSTYMLGNVARESSFKGFGIGRLVSFLSVCYVNSIGGTVTSDRDTSDKAGKQLVDSLKMIGAKQSEQFDYVGYFLRKLERTYFDSKGNYKDVASHHMAPRSDKTGIAAITKGIHDDRLQAEFEKNFPELVKKVINHLKPLTPQKDDDCEPSANVVIADGIRFSRMFYSNQFPKFLEKVLTMSNQELQDILNSDERVQGFTFVLPDMMIEAGKEIMKTIDASGDLSDEEKEKISTDAGDMFADVYDAEIGNYGVAKDEES